MVLAYYISGGHGESVRMTRLLKAVYHPRNACCTWTPARAPTGARGWREAVRSEQAFSSRNVRPRQAAPSTARRVRRRRRAPWRSVLVRISADWDWLVTLQATDYRSSQDDLLRPLRRAAGPQLHRPPDGHRHRAVLVLDQNLCRAPRAEISLRRGSARSPTRSSSSRARHGRLLSRGFVEHCVVAPDNLPRTLLMYFSNALSPMEFYFQT
ncbi:hypothetical protein QYE76_056209 [Lolium multiflorum]|uniref:Uncharacterized protein n=1 Tax=Lolium multiflorum TaxID=4521 RepID=A0AAD8WQ73_LOLMU|nr:hypothetical protein QYE76_056209 [Lolium multiflorum]